ncbi:hypothetical protein AcV7_006045 [Taiwanofungus camphoratus]|nr:hypothetical protein AcV7_006045 [Antrodia cinnamomea]
MSAQKAQTEKDKGNAAFKAGDFPTAIGHYTAAVLADPANPTYPLNRAAAYLKLGKNEDAERDCTTVLKLGEGNIKAVFRRGQARVAMQKLREAEVDFRSALKLEPANEAVKQELKRVEEMLQRRVEVKSKGPADVISGPFPSTSSSAPTPKRRRIPIEVVDPSASSSTAAATTTAGSDAFMTPVSSRPLSSPSPSPSRVAAAAPMTLFTLTKRWERLQTAEERWALINPRSRRCSSPRSRRRSSRRCWPRSSTSCAPSTAKSRSRRSSRLTCSISRGCHASAPSCSS